MKAVLFCWREMRKEPSLMPLCGIRSLHAIGRTSFRKKTGLSRQRSLKGKSLFLRQAESCLNSRFRYFSIKGVSGIIYNSINTNHNGQITILLNKEIRLAIIQNKTAKCRLIYSNIFTNINRLLKNRIIKFIGELTYILLPDITSLFISNPLSPSFLSVFA